MTTGGDELLTVSQAAERLGLSRKTVWLQINRGVLSAARLGSVWVITAREVDRYARENKGKVGGRPREKGGDA
jgi:excisionase family DNA binding protein